MTASEEMWPLRFADRWAATFAKAKWDARSLGLGTSTLQRLHVWAWYKTMFI